MAPGPKVTAWLEARKVGAWPGPREGGPDTSLLASHPSAPETRPPHTPLHEGL